jgi:hypothetical protein
MSQVDHWEVEQASDGMNFSMIDECRNVAATARECMWNSPGPPSTTAKLMINASGADIWGASDAFAFLMQPIGANEQITLRVRSLANTHAWAKGGVMIRNTLAANSAHADFIVSAAKGMAMQFCTEAGFPSESIGQTAGAAPVWLRIRRFESASTPGQASFSASYSTDRTFWRAIASSVGFPMAHDALIGVAVTSHVSGVETTAIIDDVRIQR